MRHCSRTLESHVCMPCSCCDPHRRLSVIHIASCFACIVPVCFTVLCWLCSTTDDPAVIAAMLPWRAFYPSHYTRSVRWSMCAREICYRNLPLRHAAQSDQGHPPNMSAAVFTSMNCVSLLHSTACDMDHVSAHRATATEHDVARPICNDVVVLYATI